MASNDDGNSTKGPLIGIGCSGLMAVVFFILLFGSALAPAYTDGRASVDESLPFVLGGGVCCSVSGLLLTGSIIWLVLSMKNDE